MNATRAAQRVKVTVGDRQVVSLVGMHLLGSLADRLGLSSGYSAAVPPAGERAPVHDRGRLLVQVAAMLGWRPLRGGHGGVAGPARVVRRGGFGADDLAGLRRHRPPRPRRAAGGAG